MKKHEIVVDYCNKEGDCKNQRTSPMGSKVCDTIAFLEHQALGGADSLKQCEYQEPFCTHAVVCAYDDKKPSFQRGKNSYN